MKNIKITNNFSIKSLGIKKCWVYDIEVENDHNFFANNILVHNSCYIQLFQWLMDNGILKEKWDKLTQEEKVNIIEELSIEIGEYVNKKSFEETQQLHYNSQEKNFKIVFELEKIALSGLFKEKARYATWTISDSGKIKNSMSVTGLEIIRSDSPEIVKPMIKNVLEMILKQEPDDKIQKYLKDCKKILSKCKPEEIAENKGLNNLEKYLLPNFKWKKGTPHQLKGLANFRFLINKLDIEGKYEEPHSGNKAKIVYIAKNQFNIESLSFIEWPEEFDKIGIQIDYKKMIENNFNKKILGLLELINKEELLLVDKKTISLFE